MHNPVVTEIATDWIERWSHESPSPSSDIFGDLDFGLARGHPRACLDAIVEVLARIPADPSDRHFQALAAGPLENFLNANGDAYIDEIELLARREPAFRLLLNGVWSTGASANVVTRLAKYRNSPW